MTTHPKWIFGVGLCCFAAWPAFAQDHLPKIAEDALTTNRVPNTTAVGRTKPPSRDASPTSVRNVERPTPRQVATDAIASSVCSGCKVDPATTGSLTPEAEAQKSDVRLNELRALAAPAQQTDLDTVQLASAHRERAKSMEEKTDGLWQSWLVSVCQGCGDQKPVRALRYEDWPNRDVPLTPGPSGAGRADARDPAPQGASVAARPHTRLEADLSPANIDSIRRPPVR